MQYYSEFYKQKKTFSIFQRSDVNDDSLFQEFLFLQF